MVAFLHKTDATPPLLRKSVLANVTLSLVFIFFSALQTKHADKKTTQTKVHVLSTSPPKELFVIIIIIISVFLEHSQTHHHHLMMIDQKFIIIILIKMVGQSHHPKSQRSRGPPQRHGSMMAWRWGELNRPMQRPKTNWFPFKFTEKKISLNFFPVDFYFTCPRICDSSCKHWISCWRT